MAYSYDSKPTFAWIKVSKIRNSQQCFSLTASPLKLSCQFETKGHTYLKQTTAFGGRFCSLLPPGTKGLK